MSEHDRKLIERAYKPDMGFRAFSEKVKLISPELSVNKSRKLFKILKNQTERGRVRLTPQNKEVLLAIHGDFPTLTLNNLWLLVKKRAPGITYEQVRKFYSLLESTEIRKTGKRERAENRPRHIDYIPIIAQPHTWQIDLMDMKKFGADHNDGYKYIMVCENILTRKCYAYKIRSKTASEVRDRYREFLREAGDDVERITTDNGNEFTGMDELNAEREIKHYYAEPYDHTHMGKVERLNRTLRNIMQRDLEQQEDQARWVDAIDNAVDVYNKHMHHKGLMGNVPNSVNNNVKNDIQIHDYIRAMKGVREANKLQAGDIVKVHELLPDSNFNKEKPKWSKEDYIVQQRGDNDFGFYLTHMDGTPLEHKTPLKIKRTENGKTREITIPDTYVPIPGTRAKLQYYNIKKIENAPEERIRNVKAATNKAVQQQAQALFKAREERAANPKNKAYLKRLGEEQQDLEKQQKKEEKQRQKEEEQREIERQQKLEEERMAKEERKRQEAQAKAKETRAKNKKAQQEEEDNPYQKSYRSRRGEPVPMPPPPSPPARKKAIAKPVTPPPAKKGRKKEEEKVVYEKEYKQRGAKAAAPQKKEEEAVPVRRSARVANKR